MSEPRRPTGQQVLAIALCALFLVGLVGWLVRGAGSDEPVPTVPPTTPEPPTEPPASVPTVSLVPAPAPDTAPGTVP